MAPMKLITRASQRIAERLTWCTASRDQAGIAKDLAESKEISEVYGLGEAGLFDEFFYFLEELEIMKLFMGLEPGRTERSSNVEFPAVILIYCGTNVHMPTGVPEVISPKDILLKYGALLEWPSPISHAFKPCLYQMGLRLTSAAGHSLALYVPSRSSNSSWIFRSAPT
jgi:hypothetical protein